MAETPKLHDPFRRKIDFIPIKKPFKGFSNDFHIETLNPTTSEYGPDPDLNFSITTFPRIGAGLLNLGNTCFLNSVLQCLTYTEPLAAYLRSGKHKISCHVVGFCALCAIQNHVIRALKSTGRILSPEVLVGNLRRNFWNKWRQEDAHEYMVNLLESMHKCCLPSGVSRESHEAFEKSLVHKIFGGRLRSQVKCQECSYSSNKFDPFLDLSLEIGEADSLQVALANFTAGKFLDGGEKQYDCQCCKQKVKALKQLTIHTAPNVLAIHLKRFDAHDPEQKIEKNAVFGSALDLKPFVRGDSFDGDVKYSLYGVLVHSGCSTYFGHYYCYVRTLNNMWYILDDKLVNHVSEREVLNQKAYMLFYVRDRKSIAPPRKLVDNIAKEGNVQTNFIGNRYTSTSNNALKDYPNDHVETRKKLLNADPSRVSCLNENAILKEEACSLLCENAVVYCDPSNRSLNDSSLNQKQLKKSKKKFLKYQGSSMQLRPILFFMTNLGPRKNNHKKSKRSLLGLKYRSKEKLNNQATSSDVGKTFSLQQDDKRDQMQNSEMRMLTRCLEETVVARWDDTELPSSQPLESKNDKIASIGYVGDEWDEEYDKGKRKKLRRGLKQSFGGPNIFQKIATEKSNKLKWEKLKRL